jgi:hypothetical protein
LFIQIVELGLIPFPACPRTQHGVKGNRQLLESF